MTLRNHESSDFQGFLQCWSSSRRGRIRATTPVNAYVFSFLSDLLRWFGQGLLTRPSSSTDGLPVPERRCVTWRPMVGRTAGSGGPARASYRQRLFVEHDLVESTGSAVDAARRAGYSTPHPAGGQHATKCYVQVSRYRGGNALPAARPKPQRHSPSAVRLTSRCLSAHHDTHDPPRHSARFPVPRATAPRSTPLPPLALLSQNNAANHFPVRLDVRAHAREAPALLHRHRAS